MCIIPVGMIKHRDFLSDNVFNRLQNVQRKLRHLEEEKCQGNMPEFELNLFKALLDEEKVLKHRINMGNGRSRLEAKSKTKGLKKIYGSIMLFVFVVVFLSILLTTSDRQSNSCGLTCRYLLSYITFWTPVDVLLLSLIPAYPFDVIIGTLLLGYLFLASFSTLKFSGISLLGKPNYLLLVDHTPSKQLIIKAVLLILTNLGWVVTFFAIAPQYTMFGSQSFNLGSSPDAYEKIYACQIDSSYGI
jgi:hypothetical protein